jgi:hypothetical protein
MTLMKRTCSICQIPLKWWNTQSCMKCGQIVCKKHACTTRRRSRSSVLFSLCTDCALSVAKRRVINPTSQPEAPRADQAPSSIWSSLSGISFSGISFSGMSFSGIKKKQPQSNDQSDPIENSQKEQNAPSRSEPITPLPDPLENSQKEQNVPSRGEPITPFPDPIENSQKEQNDPPPDKPATPPEEPGQDGEQTD